MRVLKSVFFLWLSLAVVSLSVSAIDEGNKVVAGNGEAGFVDGMQARLNKPIRMAPYGPGNILVADISNHAIRIVSKDGLVTTIAGGPDKKGQKDGPAEVAMFDGPHGVAVSKEGVIAVADASGHTVRIITKETAVDGSISYMVKTIAGVANTSGMQDGPAELAMFNSPHGLVWDNDGGLLVVDIGNASIRRIKDGVVSTVLPAGTEGMVMPIDIGTSPDGSFLIADAGNNQALRWSFGSDGVEAVKTDRDLKVPHGISGGTNGTVYVAELGSHQVTKIFEGHTTILVGDGEVGLQANRLNKPAAVLVHDGLLWIADLNNHRITAVPLKTDD
jgi:hypothetical protein